MKTESEISVLFALSALLSAMLIVLGAAGVWLPGLPPELTWLGAVSLVGGAGLLAALLLVVRRHRKDRAKTRNSPKPAVPFDPRFTRALDNINSLNQEIAVTVARLKSQKQGAAIPLGAPAKGDEPPPGEGGGHTLH